MHKTALITGASKGLGKTLARFLAQQNYNLILTARGRHTLQTTANELKGEAEIIALPGDVADAEHRRRLVNAARQLGGLHLLINNASTLGPTPMSPLAEFPLEAFRYLFDVNVLAPLALVQEALPLLKTSQGLVVNLSSDAAVGGYPTWGGYGASKAALDLLSLTLANELKDSNIGVVSVDPGDLRTDMHQAAFPGEDISDRPLPEVTLPFWGWLFGQTPLTLTGQRFRAQAEQWEVA
ncbi:MAG TPA: SDR family oxidoreductase [Anaerolineales bacterium]|nr:SDR family oxidoreductase [Anaerolineales bacterium]